MRYKEILTELNWHETASVAQIIKRYPEKYMHFAKIPKLGINPQKSHRDPYGIYCYPNEWLLNKISKLSSQYATNFPYWYLLDIDFSNILNLNTITDDQVVDLAERNGWINELQLVRDDKTLIYNTDNFLYRTHPELVRNTIGGEFWSTMDYLANVLHIHSWNKMLKGVDGLYDPGMGFIHFNEPAQVAVFNPAALKIIDHGQSKFKNSTIIIINELKKMYPELKVKTHKPQPKFSLKEFVVTFDNFTIRFYDLAYGTKCKITLTFGAGMVYENLTFGEDDSLATIINVISHEIKHLENDRDRQIEDIKNSSLGRARAPFTNRSFS